MGQHGTVTYLADRWACDGSISYDSNTRNISFAYTGGRPNIIYQGIPSNLAGKVVTLAIKARSPRNAYLSAAAEQAGHADIQIKDGITTYTFTAGDSTKIIVWSVDGEVIIDWMALYEGYYTPETLPPYVPKGSGAEFAECLRYYQIIGGSASTTDRIPASQLMCINDGALRLLGNYFVPMRIVPTIRINGSYAGQPVSLRDPSNNSYLTGNLVIWNNGMNTRPNGFWVEGALGVMGHVYEGYIEAIADL